MKANNLKRKKSVVDLSGLAPDQRERVERALHPRDTVFSRRFRARDVEAWRLAAERAQISLRDWIEGVLNLAARERVR